MINNHVLLFDLEAHLNKYKKKQKFDEKFSSPKPYVDMKISLGHDFEMSC